MSFQGVLFQPLIACRVLCESFGENRALQIYRTAVGPCERYDEAVADFDSWARIQRPLWRRASSSVTSAWCRGEHVDLLQIPHYDIGAFSAQEFRVTLACYTDDITKASRVSGAHSGNGILDNDGTGRKHVQFASRLQKSIRIRLALQPALLGNDAVHARVEQVRQSASGQHALAVPAGRDDRRLDTCRPANR